MCALLDVDAFDWEQLCVVLADLSTLVDELSYGTTSQLLSRCLTPRVSSVIVKLCKLVFVHNVHVHIVQRHVRVQITVLLSLAYWMADMWLIFNLYNNFTMYPCMPGTR